MPKNERDTTPLIAMSLSFTQEKTAPIWILLNPKSRREIMEDAEKLFMIINIHILLKLYNETQEKD